ncbi:hypothetical protein BVRB_1g010220 [Beta vulgaris subsp. vulgaris]|nr:hypothetical protein BVRB_1g010220 [Beta vulgaris subsp. vulgaris]
MNPLANHKPGIQHPRVEIQHPQVLREGPISPRVVHHALVNPRGPTLD